jgi:hypothetical protein
VQPCSKERMMTDRDVSLKPLFHFEEVKLLIKSVLITKTGDFTCWMYVKDFQFERSLMQEHFNDNYLKQQIS